MHVRTYESRGKDIGHADPLTTRQVIMRPAQELIPKQPRDIPTSSSLNFIPQWRSGAVRRELAELALPSYSLSPLLLMISLPSGNQLHGLCPRQSVCCSVVVIRVDVGCVGTCVHMRWLALGRRRGLLCLYDHCVWTWHAVLLANFTTTMAPVLVERCSVCTHSTSKGLVAMPPGNAAAAATA